MKKEDFYQQILLYRLATCSVGNVAKSLKFSNGQCVSNGHLKLWYIVTSSLNYGLWFKENQKGLFTLLHLQSNGSCVSL